MFRRLLVLISLVFATAALAAVDPAASERAHYAVELRVEPEGGRIAVDAALNLPPARSGDELELVLGRSYAVAWATAGPHVDVSVEPTNKPFANLQRIHLRYSRDQAKPRLQLRYAGPLNPSGDPPLNVVTPALVELNLDSMWLPIRSDLGLPFSVEATIAGLPPGAVVVSQGTVERLGTNVRIRRVEPAVDFAFAAAPGLKPIRTGLFTFYAREPDADPARTFQKHASSSLAYLQRWLGAYPHASSRLVVVSRPRTSGYARAGYLVLSDASRGEVGNAKFIAHELAHGWFANANSTTEHRWLDEALSEYVALRYVEAELGGADMETLLAAKRKTAVDAGPVTGAGVGSYAALYAKAPLLLLELENRIGRSVMDQLVSAVAAKRIGETSAFVEELQRLTDSQTSSWFAQRLAA